MTEIKIRAEKNRKSSNDAYNDNSDNTVYRELPSASHRPGCPCSAEKHYKGDKRTTHTTADSITSGNEKVGKARLNIPSKTFKSNEPAAVTELTPAAMASSGRYCKKPDQCARIQSMMDESERGLAMLAQHDDASFKKALTDAMDSFQSMKTFDDVEELLEIQAWDDIQKRLQMLIKDKRQNLARREARRQAELEQRKLDFHNRVCEQVSEEKQDRIRATRELYKMLVDTSQPGTSRQCDERTRYDQFKPTAESTRLSVRRQGGGRGQNSGGFGRRLGSCSCYSDPSDESETEVDKTAKTRR